MASVAASRRSFDSEEVAHQCVPDVDASPEDKGEYVYARWQVQDEHYRGLYRMWIKVLFFLVGKQWLKWNEGIGTYELPTDLPKWKQQPVTNLTYAIFRTAVAKLTKSRPKCEVVPPSADSDDRQSAKIAEAVLDFFYRHLKTPQKMLRAIGWFVCTGNVFINVDWDEEGGRALPRTVLVEVPHTDPMAADEGMTEDTACACDEKGEPYRRKLDPTNPDDAPALDGGDPYDLDRDPELEAEGEVEITIDDPFSVRFNPEATDPEEAEEWYVAKLWPRQRVVETFDIDIENLASDGDAGDLREQFDDSMSRVAASPPDPFTSPQRTHVGHDQSDAIGDRTLVIYYYRKPSAKNGYPKGRHWITAGRVKVWPPEGDAEYPNGEAELPGGFWPPRIPMIDTPIPGQPQGLGMLTQVVPLNEQLNHLDGKIAEKHVVDTMGGVWFVAPMDAGITISSQPGQVKVSKQMGKIGRDGAPFQAVLQPLSEGVYRERDVIFTKTKTVVAMSDIDMGQRPPGVSAGRAMLVIQESSDTSIGPALETIEHVMEEIGRRELVLVQQHYTEERTISIRGDKGKWESLAFKGADLRDGLDVRVQVGSAFPWSKSAQWDTKLNLMQALPQLFTKPDGTVDMELAERMLDSGIPGLGAFETDGDPDGVEVEMEHAMFASYDPTSPNASNQLPTIEFWQNHAAHMTRHFEFMKRSRSQFDKWSPAAQSAFIDHCRLTMESVQQAINAIAPAVAPGGAPGQGDPAAQDPGAPGGPTGQPPAPGPGGPGGGAATPPLQLLRGDRAAAGQQ